MPSENRPGLAQRRLPEARRLGLRPSLCPLMWVLMEHFRSLCFGFFVCKAGTRAFPGPPGSGSGPCVLALAHEGHVDTRVTKGAAAVGPAQWSPHLEAAPESSPLSQRGAWTVCPIDGKRVVLGMVAVAGACPGHCLCLASSPPSSFLGAKLPLYLCSWLRGFSPGDTAQTRSPPWKDRPWELCWLGKCSGGVWGCCPRGTSGTLPKAM